MKGKYTLGIILAAALSLVAHAAHPTGHEPPAAKAAEAQDTKVIGLLFYADWCGSCKVLDPKLDAVKPDFAHQPVLFTRVDMTDDAAKAYAARYANYLGLGEIYAENQGRTGFMLLVDARGKKVLGSLTRNESEGDIRAAIKKSLAQAREAEPPKAEHPTSGEPPRK